MLALVCGSRTWTDKERIRQVLLEENVTMVRHGAARGADSLAGQVADELLLPSEAMPADWDKFGRAAGAIRNQAMLDCEPKPDIVIAFWDGKSRGTQHMIRISQAAGIPVRIETL